MRQLIWFQLNQNLKLINILYIKIWISDHYQLLGIPRNWHIQWVCSRIIYIYLDIIVQKAEHQENERFYVFILKNDGHCPDVLRCWSPIDTHLSQSIIIMIIPLPGYSLRTFVVPKWIILLAEVGLIYFISIELYANEIYNWKHMNNFTNLYSYLLQIIKIDIKSKQPKRM